MLVLEPEPREHAEPQPEPGITRAHDADQEVDAPHPEQGLEAVHRQDAVHAEVDGRRERAEARERLGEASSPELAREEHRERDACRSGERRERTQDRQGTAQKEGDLRVESDQGRAVHVAPVEVAAAVEEVELVPEVTVPVGGHEVDEEFRSHEQRDKSDVERPDLPLFIRTWRRPGFLRHGVRGTRRELRWFQLPFKLAMSITKR